MPSTTDSRNVLVVDDHVHTSTGLAAYLRIHGYETFAATSGEEALELAERHRPGCAILDLRMPGMNGVDLGRALRKKFHGEIKLVGMSGADDKALDYTLMLALCDFMLPKPLDVEKLIGILPPAAAS